MPAKSKNQQQAGGAAPNQPSTRALQRPLKVKRKFKPLVPTPAQVRAMQEVRAGL